MLTPEQRKINKKISAQKYREANRERARELAKLHHEANRADRLAKNQIRYAAKVGREVRSYVRTAA